MARSFVGSRKRGRHPRDGRIALPRATGTTVATPTSRAGSPSEGLTSWEDAPAPALVAKRLLDRVLGHEVPRAMRGYSTTPRIGGSAWPTAPDTACSVRGADRSCGSDSRSEPRSGPADTSFFHSSASMSRSGSTTPRRFARTSARTSCSEPPPRQRSEFLPRGRQVTPVRKTQRRHHGHDSGNH